MSEVFFLLVLCAALLVSLPLLSAFLLTLQQFELLLSLLQRDLTSSFSLFPSFSSRFSFHFSDFIRRDLQVLLLS